MTPLTSKDRYISRLQKIKNMFIILEKKSRKYLRKSNYYT